MEKDNRCPTLYYLRCKQNVKILLSWSLQRKQKEIMESVISLLTPSTDLSHMKFIDPRIRRNLIARSLYVSKILGKYINNTTCGKNYLLNSVSKIQVFRNKEYMILLTLYTVSVVSFLWIVTTQIFLSGNKTFNSTSLLAESWNISYLYISYLYMYIWCTKTYSQSIKYNFLIAC